MDEKHIVPMGFSVLGSVFASSELGCLLLLSSYWEANGRTHETSMVRILGSEVGQVKLFVIPTVFFFLCS